MGYTTDFFGSIAVNPPLNEEERKFLNKFAETRRMDRENGPYYVDGSDGQFGMGQGRDDDIRDYNRPPADQPGLWCQWIPTEDGSAIEWDGGEKFYCATEWMQYLIEHFIGSEPLAQSYEKTSFLQSHTLNGEILAYGEDPDDRWKLVVEDNEVTEVRGRIVFDDEQEA